MNQSDRLNEQVKKLFILMQDVSTKQKKKRFRNLLDINKHKFNPPEQDDYQNLLNAIRYYSIGRILQQFKIAYYIKEQKIFQILVQAFKKRYNNQLKLKNQLDQQKIKSNQLKEKLLQQELKSAKLQNTLEQETQRFLLQQETTINKNLLVLQSIQSAIKGRKKIQIMSQLQDFQKLKIGFINQHLQQLLNSQKNDIYIYSEDNQQEIKDIDSKEKKQQNQIQLKMAKSVFNNQQCKTQLSQQQYKIKEHKESFSFFKGDLFDGFIPNVFSEKFNNGYNIQRNYLINTLQQYKNRKIYKTRLVYQFDKHNNHSFHDYIDNIPNTVLVVKLQNGYILSGYSEWPLIKGEQNTGPGFITSLTNKIRFQKQKYNDKLTRYDDYFMIFGNSQIRVKIGENSISSNFGILHKSFATNHKDPTILFGESNRETKTQQYQIHQVFFY